MEILLSDKYCRRALAIAEGFADGEISTEKLRFAWRDARRAAQSIYRLERETPEGAAMWAVSLLCETDIGRALTAVGQAAYCAANASDRVRLAASQGEEALLLRDVVGNPFRPVAIEHAWLAWHGETIPRLAQGIYNDRAFELAPVLADALEEAGCTCEDILAHCRAPGPHVRGCWVLDLILGKA
jgi:hypothetical protein